MSPAYDRKLGIGFGILLAMVLALCLGLFLVRSPNWSSNSTPPEPAVVHSLPERPPGATPPTAPDPAFYVMGQFGNDTGLIGRIFKQDNGRWYFAEFMAPKGMNISAPMNINGQIQEVDTTFAVVDYQDDGHNIHVILRDPTGNLVTRDSADSRNKDRVDQTRGTTTPAGTSRPITPVPVHP